MIGDVQVCLLLPDGRSDAWWTAALGWPLGAPWTDEPEMAPFEPPDGDSFVHRARADEPGVQLVLAVEDVAAESVRLVGLGAIRRPASSSKPRFVSPGGWPFELAPQRPHRRPVPRRWPGGHRSRLVQVCIDSPAGPLDAEVAFWAAATGWYRRSIDAPEFAGRLVGAGRSVQLLLHRLGPDDPGETVRAHLDLGTDHLEAETDRLVALGADRLWDGDGWITLRDRPASSSARLETLPTRPDLRGRPGPS